MLVWDRTTMYSCILQMDIWIVSNSHLGLLFAGPLLGAVLLSFPGHPARIQNALLVLSLCQPALPPLSAPSSLPGAGWQRSATGSSLALASPHWGLRLSPGTGGESGVAGGCHSPCFFSSHKCLSWQPRQHEQRGLSGFSWLQPGLRQRDCREFKGLRG